MKKFRNCIIALVALYFVAVVASFAGSDFIGGGKAAY